MAREKASSVVALSTQEIEASSMEWTPEEEIQLFFALDGFKPVGVNKHFNIFFASERLSKRLNREIPTQEIWAHLGTLYNLDELDEMEPLPFPNDITDFTLPEAEFSTYMSKTLRESEEKKLSDSGSDIVKEKHLSKSLLNNSSSQTKDMEKKIAAKLADLPKRTQKRTRGSISLESSSPSTTPPPVQKRRRI